MDRAIIKDRVAVRAEGIIQYWPEEQRRVAEALISRYGLPHEASKSRLIWHYNIPWRRTVVYVDGKWHQFPRLHRDMVEQAIGFKVPANKINELGKFNDSLRVDQLNGELVSNCASEELNRIILNLAHDLILEHKTVAEAQATLIRMDHFVTVGWPEVYAHELLFVTRDDLLDY